MLLRRLCQQGLSKQDPLAKIYIQEQSVLHRLPRILKMEDGVLFAIEEMKMVLMYFINHQMIEPYSLDFAVTGRDHNGDEHT